uniref:Uncharacterized protein n=1 Tax=Alexandrium catenella TaxID=2925 RepID=A0A7S1LM28_ALECA
MVIQEECPSGMLQTEPKATIALNRDGLWRQTELERRFESLDQQEHALHQSQMRLFREQMAAFVRDLNLMRQELSAMVSDNSCILELVNDTREAHLMLERAQHLSADRLTLLEKSIQDAVERHGRQERQLEGMQECCTSSSCRLDGMEATKERHSAAVSALEAGVEKHDGNIERIMAALGKQSLVLDELKAKSASLHESVNGVRGSEQKIEQSQLSAVDRLSALEGATRELAEQQEVRGRHAEGAHEHLVALAGRVDAIEASFDLSGNKHAQEMQQLRVSHEQHAASLEKLEASHQMSAEEMGALRTVASEVQAATQQRLALMESLLGDSGSRHSKQLQAIRDTSKAHAESLASIKATQSSHAGLEERLDQTERFIRETFHNHEQELDCLRLAQAEMPKRIRSLEDLVGETEAVREALELQAAGSKAVELQHASVLKRLERAEEKLSDSVHLYNSELAGLQEATLRLESDLVRVAKEEKARTLVQCSMSDRLSVMEKTIDDKFDRIDSRLSVVRGIWARDREQLLGARRQIDHMTDTLQQEVLAKEELSQALHEADRARRRGPLPGSDAPPAPTIQSLALATLSARSGSCPRGLRMARSTSPRLPCDWDEAIRCMQAKGIVHAEDARCHGATNGILQGWP